MYKNTLLTQSEGYTIYKNMYGIVSISHAYLAILMIVQFAKQSQEHELVDHHSPAICTITTGEIISNNLCTTFLPVDFLLVHGTVQNLFFKPCVEIQNLPSAHKPTCLYEKKLLRTAL